MIRQYFAIQIGDKDKYYLKKYNGWLYYRNEGHSIFDLVELTKSIDDIDQTCLFERFSDADKFLWGLYATHTILRITTNPENNLNIVPINKMVWEPEDFFKRNILPPIPIDNRPEGALTREELKNGATYPRGKD